MRKLELQKIADAWIKLYYIPDSSDERKQYFWAYNKLSELCDDEPEACWEVIQLIRSLDSSDVVHANLASGPLESLLATHGNDFIDRFELLAKTDQEFKKLLGAVWKNNINDSTWNRIQAIAGKTW